MVELAIATDEINVITYARRKSDKNACTGQAGTRAVFRNRRILCSLFIRFDTNMSLDDVGIKCLENRVQIFSGMNIEADRTGKIKREDAHDRFCVDDITSDTDQNHRQSVEVIHKGLDLVNGIQEIVTVFIIYSFSFWCRALFQDVFSYKSI